MASLGVAFSEIENEILTSDASTDEARQAIKVLTDAAIEMIHRKHTQQISDRVIQILRGATELKSDLHTSIALVKCLAARFQMTHVIDDYEEAIAIADKIVAARSPGESLTPTQTDTILLIFDLLVFRFNSYSRPEYLEDTIQRIRTLLSLPSLPDHIRAQLSLSLDSYVGRRFNYFGVAENSGETPPTSQPYEIVFSMSIPAHLRGVDSEDDPSLQILENTHRLQHIEDTVLDDETMDVEAVVELSRTFVPSRQIWPFFPMPIMLLADILVKAHQRTRRLDYLNEAITTYRDVRKMSTPKSIDFNAGIKLLRSLLKLSELSNRRQDFEEAMRLFPEVVNDGCGEAYIRFMVSAGWAWRARINRHPSISAAYESAMSLMQEILVSTPTLQIQHFRLGNGWSLPSDYASYLIETAQFNRAIETLEQGRAIIWSEMRGLRASTNQLRVADPASADKLADFNRRLELLTMSVSRSRPDDSGTGAGRREGMDPIEDLVTTQRRLLEERNTLISHIQSLPGFESFLKSPSFDVLGSAAACGPVIIINQSEYGSHIIVLKDSSLSVIFLPSNFHDRANQLKDDLLHVQKEKGLDSVDYELTLAAVLADLYELVGKPVIERLRQLEVRQNSRVWWCPTGAFCSLPLHAMGPVPSGDGEVLYFSDLYITSYTPTLSALIESRKHRSLPRAFDKPSLLLVAQPETLFGALGEFEAIRITGTPMTTLVSAMATPKTVVEGLRDHQFSHFACHGLLEPGKPFEASFELYGDNLTLLEIVRSQLPAADFAFLSACHTAELTEDSLADEGLHLAAAMQYCGFRSIVGTMWVVADMDGADLSKHFYKSIFSDTAELNGVPYHERSARALQLAVRKLRRKRGISLERWVNFVHYGA